MKENDDLKVIDSKILRTSEGCSKKTFKSLD